MIYLIVAFDNEDDKLGIFFSRCAENVIKSIDEGWNCISIDSRSLNDVHLKIRTGQFRGNFIFISFTHGSESTLSASGSRFLQSPVEPNYLANSFSYCFACKAGKILGRELVEKGTHTFMGYVAEVNFVVGYVDVFANCAVEGFLQFCNGSNIFESFILKKSKYTEEIDNVYKDNYLVASVLMDNRDCMVLYGKTEMQVNDFIY